MKRSSQENNGSDSVQIGSVDGSVIFGVPTFFIVSILALITLVSLIVVVVSVRSTTQARAYPALQNSYPDEVNRITPSQKDQIIKNQSEVISMLTTEVTKTNTFSKNGESKTEETGLLKRPENVFYVERTEYIEEVYERYQRDLQWEQKSLSKLIEQYGEESIQVATKRNDLGVLYFRLAKYDVSMESFKLASSSYIKIFKKKEHIYVATTKNNIGSVYFKLGNYRLALQHFEESLKVRRDSLSQDHLHIKMSEEWLQACRDKLEYN